MKLINEKGTGAEPGETGSGCTLCFITLVSEFLMLNQSIDSGSSLFALVSLLLLFKKKHPNRLKATIIFLSLFIYMSICKDPFILIFGQFETQGELVCDRSTVKLAGACMTNLYEELITNTLLFKTVLFFPISFH